MNQQGHADALGRLAAGLSADSIFAVERSQVAGTPALWDEMITLQAGGEQRFLRVRSSADEGGAPIGRWWSPAPAARAQSLAKALHDAAIWTLQSAPVAPGEELITWRWVTAAGVGRLSVTAGSPLLIQLTKLDLEFRRVANELVNGHLGAELTCQVSLAEPDTEGGATDGSVWLVNEGSHDCLVANPLLRTGRGSDFFRLELGHLDQEEPGVTGLGIQYSAMPMPRMDAPPPPWDNPYLLLRAGDFLECPVGVPLNPPGQGRHFLRAVYSRYGDDSVIGGVPVVRGRAFSEEHELEVLGGKIRIKGTKERRGAPRTTKRNESLIGQGPTEPNLLRTAVEGAPAVMEPPVQPGPPPPQVEESSEPPEPEQDKERSFGPDPRLLKTRLDK